MRQASAHATVEHAPPMEPPRQMLILAHHRVEEAAAVVPPGVLLFTLQPGLGGAWSELRGPVEIVRFGYPMASANPWFQVTADPGRRHHNAATQAIERIVFARGIGDVYLVEAAWEAMVRRALVHSTGAVLRRIGDPALLRRVGP